MKVVVEIKLKPVTLGLVVAILIGLILGILTSWGDLLGYLTGSVVVAYLVGGNYKDGAINGVIVGVISSLVVLILSLFGLSVVYTMKLFLAGWVELVTVMILAIIIGAVTGTIGGIIGILIKNRNH